MKSIGKKILSRAVLSFFTGASICFFISMIIQGCISLEMDYPVLDEFAAFFPTRAIAYTVQIFLMGVISATFAACSIIFELERWSFLKQGVVHFIITTCVWFPIITWCFGLLRYNSTVISTFLSFLVTYVILWVAGYLSCRSHIAEINRKLDELNKEEENANWNGL